MFGRHFIDKYQTETLHMGYDISLPELGKRTISYSLGTTGKLPFHLNIPKGIQSEIPQWRLKWGWNNFGKIIFQS